LLVKTENLHAHFRYLLLKIWKILIQTRRHLIRKTNTLEGIFCIFTLEGILTINTFEGILFTYTLEGI